MNGGKLEITSRSPEETGALAHALAPLLAPGDVILLTGDLAAGKTCFVKALGAALGVKDLITSPTYAIADFHDCNDGQLLHVDAYRLESIEEYRDLGLEDFYDRCITVVEWGQKVAGEFSSFLQLDFHFRGTEGSGRTIALSGSGPEWEERIAKLKEAM